MTSLTISPSIDQAALLNFQDGFHSLAQQSESKLVASKAIKFVSAAGKTTNYARIGRLELTEVNTRNPDKEFADWAVDNRQFTKRRFTLTVQLDAKFDINELIKDPSSDILKQLNSAKERQIDRIAIAAASGPVLTGAPDAAATSTSAANDGVLTVDGTAGFTYDIIQLITENFINNELPDDLISGATLCVSGTEHTDLMGEVEFINNDYMPSGTVGEGLMKKAGAYQLAKFPGSKNGGITVLTPVLTETTTQRTCVALAPGAIVMAMELARLEVEKSNAKVNSWDITIDFWINAMRSEGARVQLITTTI